MAQRKLGVVCFESWSGAIGEDQSVLPTLELLERLKLIRFRYSQVGTKDHLKDLAGQWTLRKFDQYKLGFFACHGSEQTLYIGENDEIRLDELAAHLEGDCPDRIFYFGSCETLSPGRRREYEQQLSMFKQKTRAPSMWIHD